MFGDISFFDNMQAQVESRAADFLKADSQLIVLTKSSDPNIATQANALYVEHKQLQNDVITTAQTVSAEKDSGTYSFATITSGVQILAKIKTHLDKVNALQAGAPVDDASLTGNPLVLIAGGLAVTILWVSIWTSWMRRG